MSDIDLDSKVYAVSETKKVSMRELLASFQRHGTARVTDLHLKFGLAPTYRVDGQVKITNGRPLDHAALHALARSLLNEKEMGTLDQLRSVNSSCAVDGLRIRVNAFHDRCGLSLAIRALDLRTPVIEDIGFPNGVWEDIVDLRQGLVLLAGTTGAGKSTTIAALLNHIARHRACHIITLEDPIEYQLESGKSVISQRAIGRDVPSYERGLRDCLREDPDVIFVGEMTDQDSAAWTLTAAETGHLVFSALHTRNAPASVTRVLDMFPENRSEEVANQLSLGLRYILAQKLLQRGDKPGRVVGMEVLNNTFGVSNLIRQVKPEQIYSLMQTHNRDVTAQRMSTLEHSLSVLVRAGRLTLAEAERAANYPSVLADEMQRKSD